jgi:hypothetical protein
VSFFRSSHSILFLSEERREKGSHRIWHARWDHVFLPFTKKKRNRI